MLEEQRKFQQEMKARIDRQLQELRTSTSDRPGRDTLVDDREQAQTSGNPSRTGACFNCGRPGHYARDGRQRSRQDRDRPNKRATPGDAVPMSTGADVDADAVSVNHMTHMRAPNRATNNAVYTRGVIIGRSQPCLIDTGSEVSLVPYSMVQG